MKTYYVLWTYMGAFSPLMQLQGESAQSVGEAVVSSFSADFRKHGTVYVWDSPPKTILGKGALEAMSRIQAPL